MRITSTTESKRSQHHRLLYLVCLPVACALLVWGGHWGPDTAARAEESASLAPATATLTVATAAAASAAGKAKASADPGEAEYKIPLPCPPPADRIKDHPLEGVIAFMRAGKSTETRDWVLPLLVKALATPMREARITGYSSRDGDGGGPWTRWGTRVRWGICAADPRYWGPGSVIWMGDPVNQVLVVEDTGSAVKGRDRFDVCTGDNPASSARIGFRHANYVPLYVAEPRSAWGDKPDNWRPPVPQG
jgi:3D (Asp-Asp-Asp) domain-containing protein